MAAIFNAPANAEGYRAAIHTVVHRLGRHFGFQAFNLDPRTEGDQREVWSPATIFVASDHLYHLLVRNYMRRDKDSGTETDVFARSVEKLHDLIFQGYGDWCAQVALPEHVTQVSWLTMQATGAVEWEYLLEELALYFLIYTEAANIRHLPEGMWFLFWILRNSSNRYNQVSCPPPSDPGSAAHTVNLDVMRGIAQWRTRLRNEQQMNVASIRASCGIPAVGAYHSVADLPAVRSTVQQAVVGADVFDASSPEVRILAEMIMYGDSGVFLDKIISPIFRYLCVEVDKKGGAAREVSERVAYDDANESFCRKDSVKRALRALGVEVDAGTGNVNCDPYDALLAIGFRETPKEGVLPEKKTKKTAAPPLDRQLTYGQMQHTRDWDPNLARDWYGQTIFAKTFVERRSFWTIYRAFYRVFAFHVLEFQLLATISWSGHLWVVTTTLLTHAGLSLAEQWANLYSQRPIRRTHRLHGQRFVLWGRPLWGFLQWFVINAVLWAAFVAYIGDWSPSTRKIWGPLAAVYFGINVGHAILTTRPGYTVSLTHGTVYYLRKCESCGCPRFFTYLPEKLLLFLGASSARPFAKEYLMPVNMKVPVATWLSNVVFWTLVLGAKVTFDWFGVIQPLEGPVKALWNRGWLNTGTGNYKIGGKDSGVPFFDADFVLDIARVVPAVLTTFVDTGIFYALVAALFGTVKGLVKLNLGVVSNFQAVRQNFHKGPNQWWDRAISQQGQANITRAIENLSVCTPASTSPPRVGAVVKSPGTSRRNLQRTAGAPKISTRSDNFVGRTGNARRVEIRQQSTTIPSVLSQMLGSEHERSIMQTLRDENVGRWLVFSDSWNAIVGELRDMDYISNLEQDNLLFTHLPIDDTIEPMEGMRPILLPIFFYAGQIVRACEVPGIGASQTTALLELRALFTWLLLQIGAISRPQSHIILEFEPNEYADSLEHQGDRSRAMAEVAAFLHKMDDVQRRADDEATRRARTKIAFGMKDNIAKICDFLDREAEAVLKVHKDPPDLEGGKSSESQLRHSKASRMRSTLMQIKAENLKPSAWDVVVGPQGQLAVLYAENEDTSARLVMKRVVRQLLKMLEMSAMASQPRGLEAQRVLSFFLSSLKNPTLTQPPPVEEMLSFNTLTPHYEEDVIYALSADNAAFQMNMDKDSAKGLGDLITENEDNVSVMTYMKSIYPQDWANLIERLRPRLGGLAPESITEEDFDGGGALQHIQNEVLLWASYRGQLLARTVRGMMMYEQALRRLARIENPKPDGLSEEEYAAQVDDLVESKFTYIVASQVYGKNRSAPQAKGRWLARGMETLLYQYPGLRCAFIDDVTTKLGKTTYSVLIRGGQHEGPQGLDSDVEEMYRVRLPFNPETGRGVVLGEGKPENQNCAIIFAFNEIVQAIDMNQDNNLGEALKMRNLVSEFTEEDGKGRHYDHKKDMYSKRNLPEPRQHADTGKKGKNGKQGYALAQAQTASQRRAARKCKQPVALVGFREWIFSENSGALASFAAATEFTFGTIVQRVMTWPGTVRFHYGHPDLWNKLFIMTRGGVSKATRGFHISEDVFAGYNHTLRGGSVKFKEYISVGKGRDMGFDSINSFESKVAGGNGEQVLSRDVYRLGTRLDFFRLMSWYHTGCGFFINTYLTMLSIYAAVWVYLLLALTKSATFTDENGVLRSTITGNTSAYSSVQIVQLGMLSIITYAVELLLERGVVHTLASIFVQAISGSIAFFVFRAQTSAYYFKQDILYGGAKYIPTGRGYALRHNSFVKVYTSYARSHLYFAAEIVLLLILLAVVGFDNYGSSTWGPWLAAVCILIAPFWFNPGTFSMTVTSEDYYAWRLWVSDVQDPVTKTTWYSWNRGQLEKPRNEKKTLTAPYLAALWGLIESLPNVIITVAAIDNMAQTRQNKWAVFGVFTGIVYAYIIVFVLLRKYMHAKFYQRAWRLARITLILLGLAGIILFITVYIPRSAGQGVRNVFILLFANFEIAAFIVQLLLYVFPNWALARYYVDLGYRIMDVGIGYFLFAFLFLLSFLQLVARVQTALLFNIKFASSLRRGRLLQGTYIQAYIDRQLQQNKQAAKERSGSLDGASSAEFGLAGVKRQESVGESSAAATLTGRSGSGLQQTGIKRA
ncbi:hypothetical protein WJX72_008855 [[Myrmecia] bisecta]|uniref:1,3-beta-glucan synthase n=1 Tax=[Myrmecia] bisecta TaxID=41462 RepID=A0AAW1Q5Y9_9CHLO